MLLYSPKNGPRILREYWFGWRHHVDVAGRIELHRPADIDDIDITEALHYEACPQGTFHSLFKLWNSRIDVRKYNFVDLGSRKGFILCLASSHRLREIVGVEHSLMLHKIAEQNIKSCRTAKQQCREIRALCLPAQSYEFEEIPLIRFLYNFFVGTVFASVVEKLEELAKKVDVYTVYVNPQNQVLNSSPVFKLVENNPSRSCQIWGPL